LWAETRGQKAAGAVVIVNSRGAIRIIGDDESVNVAVAIEVVKSNILIKGGIDCLGAGGKHSGAIVEQDHIAVLANEVNVQVTIAVNVSQGSVLNTVFDECLWTGGEITRAIIEQTAVTLLLNDGSGNLTPQVVVTGPPNGPFAIVRGK